MLGALARAGVMLANLNIWLRPRRNSGVYPRRPYGPRQQGVRIIAGATVSMTRWQLLEMPPLRMSKLAGHLTLFECTLKPEYLEFCVALA